MVKTRPVWSKTLAAPAGNSAEKGARAKVGEMKPQSSSPVPLGQCEKGIAVAFLNN